MKDIRILAPGQGFDDDRCGEANDQQPTAFGQHFYRRSSKEITELIRGVSTLERLTARSMRPVKDGWGMIADIEAVAEASSSRIIPSLFMFVRPKILSHSRPAQETTSGEKRSSASSRSGV